MLALSQENNIKRTVPSLASEMQAAASRSSGGLLLSCFFAAMAISD
ncbi:hypothetical protein [Paenibacillus sp. GCM10012306]